MGRGIHAAASSMVAVHGKRFLIAILPFRVSASAARRSMTSRVVHDTAHGGE